MCLNNYLYEIIENYKYADSEKERSDILKSFCSSIWASSNKRKVYPKTIRFRIRKDLRETEIGQIFNSFSEIQYTGYKSTSKETDWCSLIRQKVNNLYTRYFDKAVILKKEYLDLLKTPKSLYYQWTDGEELDSKKLPILLQNALDNAHKKKEFYQKQKIDLSWKEYKKVIERFFYKIFQNCKLLEDYEKNTTINPLYDFMNEDNFYIRYFCKYLEGEMLKWQKQYYGVRDHKKYKACKTCGRLIEKSNNRVLYCTECRRKKQLQWNKNYKQKRKDSFRKS